jgi:hypothetical protein
MLHRIDSPVNSDSVSCLKRFDVFLKRVFSSRTIPRDEPRYVRIGCADELVYFPK